MDPAHKRRIDLLSRSRGGGPRPLTEPSAGSGAPGAAGRHSGLNKLWVIPEKDSSTPKRASRNKSRNGKPSGAAAAARPRRSSTPRSCASSNRFAWRSRTSSGRRTRPLIRCASSRSSRPRRDRQAAVRRVAEARRHRRATIPRRPRAVLVDFHGRDQQVRERLRRRRPPIRVGLERRAHGAIEGGGTVPAGIGRTPRACARTTSASDPRPNGSSPDSIS